MLYLTLRQLFRILFFFIFRLRAVGQENIPPDGPVVLCANHISNLDPPVLGTPLRRKVHYMAKAELFQIPLLGSIITKLGAFPVKRGGVSKDSIRAALKMLEEGRMLGIFPQGTRNNSEGMGKKGAAMLAIKSGATVVPVAIVGKYNPITGITLRIGKPVDLSEFAAGGSDALEAATDKIMRAIGELKREPR